jgi:hypothetical protein
MSLEEQFFDASVAVVAEVTERSRFPNITIRPSRCCHRFSRRSAAASTTSPRCDSKRGALAWAGPTTVPGGPVRSASDWGVERSTLAREPTRARSASRPRWQAQQYVTERGITFSYVLLVGCTWPPCTTVSRCVCSRTASRWPSGQPASTRRFGRANCTLGNTAVSRRRTTK